jgi:3-keto-disaccharide hydrolase
MTTILPRTLVPFACLACLLGSSTAGAADNEPPPGFVALFNGRDLSGWKGLVADPPARAKMSPAELAEAQEKADQRMRDHWKAKDGMLVYDGKGASLCTAKDYGDFELLVDWKILDKGDSGIYLRGSPQVQIWDPQVSIPEKGIGSGGLFNNQKHPSRPTVTADKPVGEWNAFRIRMVGDKVSVWLNDKLVVDEVVLENYWDRDKPIYPAGQIELQHHGNTLFFKNVFLKEL